MARFGSRFRRRSSATEVMTTAGPVTGTLAESGTMAHWLGVPYAEPPVGDRRWKPPIPPTPWRKARACTKVGPFAYQRLAAFEAFFQNLVDGLGLGPARRRALSTMVSKAPIRQSEDCLTLNVRAPAMATGLPVMVWIHGGDHTDGSGGEPHYQSDALPERGCVLVTINYRLGLFGFFAHPDLAAESADRVSGNYGLLDQITALEWVRDNIAGFGGDPSRVTIFGESAGGEAVLNLMTAPRARGLFHRAIAQSPSDSGRWLHLRRPVLDFDAAEDAGVSFADRAVGPEPGQLARLRAMDPDELSDLYRAEPQLGRHFYPAVDGVVLPTTPMSAFSDGAQASVPLMIGYTSDEGSLLADFMHPAGGEFYAPVDPETRIPLGPDAVGPEGARAAFERSYPSPQHVDRLMAAYPGLSELERSALVDHSGDHMFGVHVDHASRQHAAAGHPVWRYHFRARPASESETIGAFHAADIFYVFDTRFPLVPEPEDAHLLKREMGDRWFAFAATGVPDFPGRVHWPTYDPADPHHMVFDRPESTVEPCPARPGLDLMRERVAWLTDKLRLGAASSTSSASSADPTGAST